MPLCAPIVVANEAYDLYLNQDDGLEWAIGAGVKDLWNTMLWPTVLLFVGRYTDWFQRPHHDAASAFAPPFSFASSAARAAAGT
jgi:hypothetical protein